MKPISVCWLVILGESHDIQYETNLCGVFFGFKLLKNQIIFQTKYSHADSSRNFEWFQKKLISSGFQNGFSTCELGALATRLYPYLVDRELQYGL